MNKKREATQEEPSPQTRETRRLSLVWIIPLVAVVLGGWLVFRHLQSQGPLIEVQFGTADGIVAGKTEVRSRSVKVGMVEDVRLADDLKGVVVKIRLDPKAAGLARLDTLFWVVRPRVSGASISGLGTIISGAYIELDPGSSEDTVRSYVGLEEPPVTPSGVPGLRLNLLAADRGQAGVGSPVLYEGNEVGTIERRRFNAKTKEVELRAFIYKEYSSLVTENVRFWHESGVEVTAGAEGFKLKLPSIETLLAGGIAFGLPEGIEAGAKAQDDSNYVLYGTQERAAESVFRSGGEFLLLFDQSVRGLVEGAKVEFRGLQVGRVAGISFLYGDKAESRRVPVLVQLNQAMIEKQFSPSMRDEGGEGMARAIGEGLRGSLRPANLLTGQLYVDLDFYDDIPVTPIVQIGDYAVLPTVETGLARLEEQIAAVLNKLEALPLQESLAKIDGAVEQSTRTLEAAEKAFGRSETAIAEVRDSLRAVRKVLENPEFSKLPGEVRETLVALRGSLEGVGPKSSLYGDLRRTMDELRGAARSIERVAQTIEEKPNSLVFGKGLKREVIPRAIPAQ